MTALTTRAARTPLLWLLAALASVAPTPGSEAGEGSSHPLVARLRGVALEAVDEGTVPGVALAVVEGGTLLHAEGIGWANEKERRTLTAETPINVASVSKSVAAWGFVRWLESEELSLDTPALPLVPQFSLPGTRSFDASRVTVRRVLSHRAGLSTPSAPVFPATRSLPRVRSILERGEGGVPRLELMMPPGIGFSYSGGGYLFMQLALEERTKESFGSFMRREILSPAGLESSSFVLTPDLRERSATYYHPKRRVRATYHLAGAAGALYSTAADMGRWLTIYAPGSDLRSRLLDEAAFRSMLEPQGPMTLEGVDTGGAAYALGHATWSSPEGTFYLFHAGGNPGVRSFYFVSPESGHGVFMVANHDHGQRVFRALIDAWGEHYGVPPPPLF